MNFFFKLIIHWWEFNFLIHQSFNNIMSYNKLIFIQPSTLIFFSISPLIRVHPLFLELSSLFEGMEPRNKDHSSASPKVLQLYIHISYLSCMCPCLLPLFYFCLPTWGKAAVKNLKSLLFHLQEIKERKKT
jgi:hypothetical protein